MTILCEMAEWRPTSGKGWTGKKGYEMRDPRPEIRFRHRESRIPNFKSRTSRVKETMVARTARFTLPIPAWEQASNSQALPKK